MAQLYFFPALKKLSLTIYSWCHGSLSDKSRHKHVINIRKSYSNIYRLLFALADCKVIYGNHFLRAKLQMQLYNVYSDIHYYFLQDF